MESVMLTTFKQVSTAAVLASLLIGGTALAQPAPNPHHPGGAAAQGQPQAPMPSGMMGRMMGGGMMGGGTMGHGMMD
ncbi:MAG: hypothetical protein C0511_19255, partial [Hyphomicrobium sp.]|nr:hypothetical protein [Hyphomicrobium sp.]